MRSAVRKRAVEVGGRATSISLEDEFYDQLKTIARQRGINLQTLITDIAAQSRQANLSSQCRLAVLKNLMEKTPPHFAK